MEITAYTLPDCGYCGHLKELFRRADVSYEEIKVREDITIEEFKEKYSDVKVFPFVVVDGVQIGGLVETIKLFLDKGLITPNKK